jgi:hypothetical protein
MARYSKTPVTDYMAMPVSELAEWMSIIGAEIKRENKETARKPQGR